MHTPFLQCHAMYFTSLLIVSLYDRLTVKVLEAALTYFIVKGVIHALMFHY